MAGLCQRGAWGPYRARLTGLTVTMLRGDGNCGVQRRLGPVGVVGERYISETLSLEAKG